MNYERQFQGRAVPEHPRRLLPRSTLRSAHPRLLVVAWTALLPPLRMPGAMYGSAKWDGAGQVGVWLVQSFAWVCCCPLCTSQDWRDVAPS